MGFLHRHALRARAKARECGGDWRQIAGSIEGEGVKTPLKSSSSKKQPAKRNAKKQAQRGRKRGN